MSRNALKIIACVSMLADHAGLLLFQNDIILRCFGRLAMPIFAYFIAEGCLKTRSLKKYFLRVFLLGVLCQAVYAADLLLYGEIRAVLLNVLLTFSVSIALCTLCIKLRETRYGAVIIILAVAAVFALCRLGEALKVPVTFDYGFGGIVLPLFAVAARNKRERLLLFFIGLAAINAVNGAIAWNSWLSLLAVPLLALYNGEKGRHINNAVFYAFYPAHIAVLYAIRLLTI